MASNFRDDSLNSLSHSDSEIVSDSGSDPESDSGTKAVPTSNKRNICKYYNTGGCRYGDKCRYEHICKQHVEGSCHYGTACRLKHNPTSRTSSAQDEAQGRSRPSSGDSEEDDDEEEDEEDDRPYRWQLNLGTGWKNICNDFILEAQYSQPSTKGINIYNTCAGAISIDFSKMRVLKKKNIRVRRKGSKQTEWLWHYHDKHGWYQYGEKGSKGKVSPIQSSKLEQEYQTNPRGSVQFSVDSKKYEINFKGMYQKNVSSNHKRRIRRRPKYEPSQKEEISQLTSSFKNMMTPANKSPVWQFEGRGGKWHTFKNTDVCSVSSEDIESCYQKQQNTMTFTVNSDRYMLDFTKMNQVNQTTNAKRRIRRVV